MFSRLSRLGGLSQLAGLAAGLAAGLVAGGCRSPLAPANPASPSTPAPEPPLDAPGVAALIPEHVRERGPWGEAVVNGLGANGLPVDRASACAVIAIVAQESGFEADPAVPGLAKVVAERIARDEARLGPLGEPIVRRLLAGRAPDDARTFEQRLGVVRTERDVDVLFRDIVAYHEANHPVLFGTASLAGKLFDVREVRALNPITTAGSMQVSVRVAEEWARAHPGKASSPGEIRDALYTRNGGVYYGTARLLAYPGHYPRAIFRFADYNAGFYASRNAAIQAKLSLLTGRRVVPDGDLLAYEKDGSVKDAETESERAVRDFAERFAPTLSASAIRADLRLEKTLELETTATYRAVEKAAAEQLSRARAGGRGPGAGVAYAILPEVAISSPKFAGTRSTAWFAQSVDRRYRACLVRAGVPSEPDRDPAGGAPAHVE
jgi:hypothetical protein